MCYTYDDLNRVTSRVIKRESDNVVISTEVFDYDKAGNVIAAPDSYLQYDTNNRLTVFNGSGVTYDEDGNMVLGGSMSCTYDSKNRLTSAGGHTYTYNAENIRIRNLCNSEDTAYTYNTNCKLSQLLCKTTNGVVTKYVYGRGLIGEEVNNVFKTYHFDSRGSTIAITDTFAYDTYGKQIARTGTSNIIFGYNGRDGVVTEDNGLIYMRARYYSPAMKRFINADIVAGKIIEAVTLNRYAYANGNPVSFVDPFGLWSLKAALNKYVAQPFNKYVAEPATKAWNKYVAEPISNGYNAFTNRATTIYNGTKDYIVDKAQKANDYLVDKFNDVTELGVEAYNTIIPEPVKDVVRDVADIAVTGIATIAGVSVGIPVGISYGVDAGLAAGVATFGVINNSANAIYYNCFSDGESNLTPSSYNIDNSEFQYLNRWDRLDYAKQETQQSTYNFNAWMYYSEYNFHMYAWAGLKGWYSEEPQNLMEKLSKSASEANVAPNDPFYDFNNTNGVEKWLRMLAYFGVGTLGI